MSTNKGCKVTVQDGAVHFNDLSDCMPALLSKQRDNLVHPEIIPIVVDYDLDKPLGKIVVDKDWRIQIDLLPGVITESFESIGFKIVEAQIFVMGYSPKMICFYESASFNCEPMFVGFNGEKVN